MLLVKEPEAEPIPGYRLLEPLGRGGFGEVWKCEAPGGLLKAIKFVAGPTDDLDIVPAPADEELQAIQLIKSLRHPFLLSMERVERIGSELVIVMELADHSLLDRFQERRRSGLPGIERQELLGYLQEAADVLDLMNRRHGLQHLDVKPANLFLVSDHLKVADFGLVRSVAHSGGNGRTLAPGSLTALYAAPELYQRGISCASDQYSLAIVFEELLTGKLPFHGKNPRQLMLAHCTAEPDLTPLPEEDRPVVARALAKDPARRFPSCTAFIRALQSGAAAMTATASGHGAGGLSAVPSPSRDTGVERSANPTRPIRPTDPHVLPGYQFLSCQGRTPFLEIWDVQAPDGEPWVAEFLHGLAGSDSDRDEAVERLESLRHPALPPIRIFPGSPGSLVILTQRTGDSLRDRYQAHRTSSSGELMPGLPRRKLLDWLGEAAAALDDLREQTGLHHLGLTPRHLVVGEGGVRLADFGLLPLLWQPAGQLSSHLQARYAAPELLTEQVSPACDSYSLAVIFQEMLTGMPPWRGRRVGPPNFDALTEADRQILAQALHDNPAKRYSSCLELIEALAEAGSGRRLLVSAGADGSGDNVELETSAIVVAELLVETGGATALAQREFWATAPRGGVSLQARFAARLPECTSALAFVTFRRQWRAQQVCEVHCGGVFHIALPGRFWQRWLSGTPGLVVELHWEQAPGLQLELTVQIAAWDKGRTDDAVVREVAPLVLESLRQEFEAFPERRGRKRLSWRHPLLVSCLQPDGCWSEPVGGEGKDISLTGMGLYLPHVLPSPSVRLELTVPTRTEPVTLLGRCVRLQRCSQGSYEVGIAFTDAE
jgi:serine/threonine protein kinase